MSDSHFAEAARFIAGGVNSPARAFKAVGGAPVFFERGRGARLYDVDGRAYIDYVCSWGAMILGHAHPAVVERVADAAARGLSFGAPTLAETALAKKIAELMPSIERARLVNSGTEAAMSALRLARGFTGRDRIVKFEGGYHGHADALLVKAGSGALTSMTRTDTRRASSGVRTASSRALNSSGPSGRAPEGGGGVRRPGASPNHSTK